MGCDIHFYVEAKGENGKWVSKDKWEKEDNHVSNYPNAYYNGRNYNMFAILANVRNGSGFAGVDTGDGFKPIADPRGVPDDASPEYKLVSKQWDGDGHSHSYFTVAELLAYDWTQTTKKRGWVNGVEFARWSKYDMELGHGPKNYSGGVSGGEIIHIDISEMTLRVNELRKQHNDYYYLCEELASFYTQVQWSTPYYRAAGLFWQETIPRLLRLGKPEDVRIVFFFDN